MNISSFCKTFIVGAGIVISVVMAGCGYTLQGKVIRGETSSIEQVHEIDPRFKGPGLPNAEVLVRRDPNSPTPTLAGRDRTDAAGNFSLSIKEFGAGWMEEQWQVRGGLPGHANAEALMKLPAKGSKWRLLITLAPGASLPLDAPADYLQDYERFK
jgi:hypothetical protein